MTSEKSSDDYGFDGPLFARSRSLLGKLTCELKTKIDEETDFAFRRMVGEMGTDVAAELRNLIYLRVHGRTYDEWVLEVQQKHVEAKRTGMLGALRGLIGGPDRSSND